MDRQIYSFGASIVVASLLTAVIYAIKAVVPGLDEAIEDSIGHAWSYMGVIGLVVFFGLGLAPVRFAKDGRSLAVQIAGAALVSAGALFLLSAWLAVRGN
ncbi:MAG: hypothetical protein EOQ28_09910 [Mesorhizobium sp.]|uniref:hypothetical protein n=1 Tax=Mesorhizobium sp. TaxID=1871066 RepID=UPI000FE62AAE|nr:hypothetical protein [Mesorhizobium sp.]RWA75399.1 MAG: hypothetical protein EOQ28_09910 [Mesorhizobium sp.]